MLDYHLLFEQSPARLLILEPDSRRYSILGASDRYLEATMTTREIASRPLFDVFPDSPGDPAADGVRNLEASLRRALASRATDVMAVQRYDVRDRSGTFVERYWAPSNAPVIGGDGEIQALVHRVEDVTSFVLQGVCLQEEAAHVKHEILQRGCELAVANGELRDTIEQRRRIVGIVSHDLRTPLASIRMAAERLKRQFIDAGAAPPRTVDVLSKSSQRMAELLSDLDDYASSQLVGLLPLSRQRTNLRDLCEEVVEAAQVAHDRVVELSPGENVTADVDPKRIRQLLANLVNNAVVYGEPTRPVRVMLRRITGACVLTVSNEGAPIPEDVIPMLFKPFQRGPGSRGAPGHMGLGLYIVQQIAHAHGATIHVESSPNGTHFNVYIPVLH